MSGIGAPELLIILLVILVLFGSTKLPKLARSVGQASKEFKKGVAEGAHDAPDGKDDRSEADEKVTLTKAELDAMLAERDAKARKESPPAT
ncbi:MAG: twin-arginine translocase TatA/TatE family subunit [Acidimicrobiales bacterium]